MHYQSLIYVYVFSRTHIHYESTVYIINVSIYVSSAIILFLEQANIQRRAKLTQMDVIHSRRILLLRRI